MVGKSLLLFGKFDLFLVVENAPNLKSNAPVWFFVATSSFAYFWNFFFF